MDIRREEISTLFVAQKLHKIPQWAKSEHMEKCTSLKELFKYSEDDAIRKKANVTYFKKWRKRWFKKKHCVVCVNEAAMDRIADDLIERGISCRTRSRDSSVSDHTNDDLCCHLLERNMKEKILPIQIDFLPKQIYNWEKENKTGRKKNNL